MRYITKKGIACLMVASMILSGCSANQKEKEVTQEETTIESTLEETIAETEAGDSFEIEERPENFAQDDYYSDWQSENPTYIHLNDREITIEGTGAASGNQIVTISRGGTYVLDGTWLDGSVQVDAKGTGTVRLVLNGVDIHSETSAAIYVLGADKTVVSLEVDTVNTLSDSAKLVDTDEEDEEPNSTIFSENDLTINGTGQLMIEAQFDHGISVKDKLILMSGEYQMVTVGSAINSKNLLVVNDGTYQIAAGNNGLHSDGGLWIINGMINVTESEEGMEAETIRIEGGEIHIKSSDDGINASTDGETEPILYITGGVITVDASGDGIDSNGSFYMTGGDVTVYGAVSDGDGALDYDGEFEISDGRLVAFGMSGMAQAVSMGSTQNTIMMTYSQRQTAGTEIILTGESGEELYRAAGEKEFNSVVISIPELTLDETYVLDCGEEQVSFVLEKAITYLTKDGVSEQGSGTGRFGGRNGMPGGGQMGGRPDNHKGQRPDGQPDRAPSGMPEGEPGGAPSGMPEGEPGRAPEGIPDGESRENATNY